MLKTVPQKTIFLGNINHANRTRKGRHMRALRILIVQSEKSLEPKKRSHTGNMQSYEIIFVKLEAHSVGSAERKM